MEAAFDYFQTILKNRTLRKVFTAEQLGRIIPVFVKTEGKFVDLDTEDPEELVFHGFSTDDMANPMFARLVMKEWELDTCYDELVEVSPSIEVYNTGLTVQGIKVTGTYQAQRGYHPHDGQAFLYFDRNPTTTSTTSDQEFAKTLIIIKLKSGSHGFSGWCLARCFADAVQSNLVDPRCNDPRLIHPMWYVPNSMGRPLPPENGWVPMNGGSKLREGTNLKIRYKQRGDQSI